MSGEDPTRRLQRHGDGRNSTLPHVVNGSNLCDEGMGRRVVPHIRVAISSEWDNGLGDIADECTLQALVRNVGDWGLDADEASADGVDIRFCSTDADFEFFLGGDEIGLCAERCGSRAAAIAKGLRDAGLRVREIDHCQVRFLACSENFDTCKIAGIMAKVLACIYEMRVVVVDLDGYEVGFCDP